VRRPPTPSPRGVASDTQDIEALLDEMGAECIYLTQGWWTYELCHRQHILQFHVSRHQTSTAILLGAFDAAATLDVDSTQPPLLEVRWSTAMEKKWRIVTVGFGTGRQKGSLNEGQIPNFRVVRVHVSTGYNRGEGNRRASRNGRVSDLPHVTIRVRTFSPVDAGRGTEESHEGPRRARVGSRCA
jgi:hypothetical protein